ncbi:hypothetical protein HZB74_02605 [Candidatus Saccharibacteria bacterium]|nr:hypothetical protein [Candidatus Saccharibacteria bacterium]
MTTIELEQGKETDPLISREQLVVGVCIAASFENGSLGQDLDDDPWPEEDPKGKADKVIKLNVDEPGIVCESLRKVGLGRRGLDQLEPDEARGLHEVIDEARHFAQEGLIKGISEEDFDLVDQRVLARAA